jgi:hypothetical protein
LRSEWFIFPSAFLFILLLPLSVFGAHPLITDDTGTQGKGKAQLELNTEFGHDEEEGEETDFFELDSILSYGVSDPVDIVLTIPFAHINADDAESGFGDLAVEVKWRFYEKENFSLAVKPVLAIPTGDDERGLGAGRINCGLVLIATLEMAPFAFHANAGYLRAENTSEEREDIWSGSVASMYAWRDNLTIVGNIGVERNPEKGASNHPAFILGGLIYSVRENLDLDIGVKTGLNEAETDYSLLAGMARRF